MLLRECKIEVVSDGPPVGYLCFNDSRKIQLNFSRSLSIVPISQIHLVCTVRTGLALASQSTFRTLGRRGPTTWFSSLQPDVGLVPRVETGAEWIREICYSLALDE